MAGRTPPPSEPTPSAPPAPPAPPTAPTPSQPDYFPTFGEPNPLSFRAEYTHYENQLTKHPGIIDEYAYYESGEIVITDQYAADLIYSGWYDPLATKEEREAARATYQDYADEFGYGDFDWDEWRDYYSEGATAA